MKKNMRLEWTKKRGVKYCEIKTYKAESRMKRNVEAGTDIR
jgi:hypothetical protein